jgi:(p)ppGpp synthase/HD superfamily hydrolase
MSKDKKPKWDGKSRVSTDLYRKRYDEIFKKKTKKEKLKETKKLLEEIADRNGF